MSWIDVHTHLNMLDMTPDQALQAASAAQVGNMITIGTCPDDLPTVLNLARKYAPRVACTLGIHPHEAALYTPEIEEFIRENALAPEVVAIGETGLDYHYDNAPRAVQIETFRAQMRLAQELGLPVEIHTRDAEPDTMTVIGEFSGRVKGLLHCFTGTWEMAKFGLDHGFYVSISGVVTFKNAGELREVVRRVPLDRLHVETDAPFLAPMPHRGKKNQPAFVTHTAELVSELKGVSPEALRAQLRINAQTLFPKLRLI
ncbi:MAG TPA: TatD family hydrolase [Bdellovibrionales bacterium]|nr:TatD family hydrolase [Bdellovibrionales bacterium]